MKCVRDLTTQTIDRVPDRIAKLLTDSGECSYTSKGRWKAADRPREKLTYDRSLYKALDGWT